MVRSGTVFGCPCYTLLRYALLHMMFHVDEGSYIWNMPTIQCLGLFWSTLGKVACAKSAAGVVFGGAQVAELVMRTCTKGNPSACPRRMVLCNKEIPGPLGFAWRSSTNGSLMVLDGLGLFSFPSLGAPPDLNTHMTTATADETAQSLR